MKFCMGFLSFQIRFLVTYNFERIINPHERWSGSLANQTLWSVPT